VFLFFNIFLLRRFYLKLKDNNTSIESIRTPLIIHFLNEFYSFILTILNSIKSKHYILYVVVLTDMKTFFIKYLLKHLTHLNRNTMFFFIHNILFFFTFLLIIFHFLLKWDIFSCSFEFVLNIVSNEYFIIFTYYILNITFNYIFYILLVLLHFNYFKYLIMVILHIVVFFIPF